MSDRDPRTPDDPVADEATADGATPEEPRSDVRPADADDDGRFETTLVLDDAPGASRGGGGGDGNDGGDDGDDVVSPPPAPRAPLSSFATDRPVAVLMVFLAAVVFGLFAAAQLPVQLMPDLSYPTLTVRTEYPGAAPEEVENDVSRPIEETLGVIGGLRRISSVSRAGVSDVVLELDWDTDVSEATQDALERLDLVLLPEEADQPLILHFDPSLDPVLELSLAGEGARFEGEQGLRRLRRIAELQVKRALEPIKGVAAVRVRGGLEEEIHVLLREDELRRTGLSIDTVVERLGQENVNLAGGTLEEGRTEYMVRTLNEYQNLEQIADTIVAVVDGREVRLRDLGEVRRSQQDREILTRTDGSESVQIDVYKEADANIVALADRVRTALGSFDPDADEAAADAAESEGTTVAEAGARDRSAGDDDRGLARQLWEAETVRLELVADRSVFIESSISEVRQTAIFGGLLAVLVLFLFLKNLRTTTIIAVAIPVSLAVTFAPLHLFGVSLNIMSLGGLALGIGMLVDSSIVVLESIFRCREEGDDTKSAAVRGTAEVRGAVVASTLTSIAVFFPMVFVEGIAGQAFGDLGLAVVVSLLASLVVAVFLIPMLASRRGVDLGSLAERSSKESFLRFDFFRRWAADMEGLFSWSFSGSPVRWLLRSPIFLVLLAWIGIIRVWIGAVIFVVGLVLRLLVWLVVLFGKRFVFPLLATAGRTVVKPFLALADGAMGSLQRGYPRLARWSFRNAGLVAVLTLAVLATTVYLFVGLGSELLPEVHQGEITFELGLPVGTPLEETVDQLSAVEETVRTEVDGIESLLVTYGFDATNTQRADEGEHSAKLKLLLDSSDPRLEEAVVAAVRQRLAQVPDLDVRLTRPVLFSSKTPIQVEVQGDDLARLKDMAETVRTEMAALPQLADVETTLKSGAPEVQILYDRERLARWDLNLRQVAEQVRDAVQGTEATRFNTLDRRIPVVVRLEQADRESVTDVSEMVINPGGERPIPLSTVARVTLGEGPSEVRRIDGQRVALIEANIAQGSLGDAVAAIDQRLSTAVDWPDDMNFFITGQNEEWERSRGSLWLALGLSVFLVYVIMAAQFENLLHPLVIMFTIPLAFFGTAIALAWLDISLSVVVFLGMIMLAGIVVNNAIVLVDYTNILRGRGLGVEEAAVTAGAVRLRPILMTTATTVLGLAPMAVGLGDGAEIRTPMAIAVIGGLITSTLLTLVVIPVFYVLLERLQARLAGRTLERLDDGVAEGLGEELAAGSRDPALGGGLAGPGFARERTVEP